MLEDSAQLFVDVQLFPVADQFFMYHTSFLALRGFKMTY